jgi:hypothetical protein
MKKTFVNRLLTFGLGVFVVLQLFFTVHQVEYFPFFLFGFFSDRVPDQAVYFEIREDKKVLKLPALTDEFVQNQLHFADFLVSEQSDNEGMRNLILTRFSNSKTRNWAQKKLIAPWKEQRFREWLSFYLKKQGYKAPFKVYRVTVTAKKDGKKTAHVFDSE